MKNVILIGILLMGIVFVSGCNPRTEMKEENILLERYATDRLSITLNGLTKDGLTAITSFNRTKENPSGELNLDFKNYFSNDLKSITQKIENIEDLKISNWFVTTNSISISIKYKKENEANEYELLNLIKNELENRWYTKKVNYDYPVHKFKNE